MNQTSSANLDSSVYLPLNIFNDGKIEKTEIKDQPHCGLGKR